MSTTTTNTPTSGGSGLLLYHRTNASAADLILASGFEDGSPEGHMFVCDLEDMPVGVWLSDFPVGVEEGAKVHSGDGILLEVRLQLTEAQIDHWEVRNNWEGAFSYREWCVPAAVLNKVSEIRMVSEEEEDEMDHPGTWPKPGAIPASHPRVVRWRRARGFDSGGIAEAFNTDGMDPWSRRQVEESAARRPAIKWATALGSEWSIHEEDEQ